MRTVVVVLVSPGCSRHRTRNYGHDIRVFQRRCSYQFHQRWGANTAEATTSCAQPPRTTTAENCCRRRAVFGETRRSHRTSSFGHRRWKGETTRPRGPPILEIAVDAISVAPAYVGQPAILAVSGHRAPRRGKDRDMLDHVRSGSFRDRVLRVAAELSRSLSRSSAGCCFIRHLRPPRNPCRSGAA